jgi:regulator of sirC expression with transglutaminase-like and TPR domain
MIKRFLLAFLSMLLCAAWAAANDVGLTPAQREAQIEALFAPGRSLEEVKLAVDGMVNPEQDASDIAAELDKLSRVLLPMVADAKGDHAKLKVLRQFIYENGPWNENRPFAYDLADPKGRTSENKLLGTYLRTRRGNCISMPILFAILGQRMGLKTTLAVAPFHMFVKFTDEAGKEWNLEPTSGGGYTRDL